MVSVKKKAIGLVCLVVFACLISAKAQDKATTWKFTDLSKIGTYTPAVEGKPAVKKTDGVTSIWFNGTADGLTIPACPIDGWHQFTIEVLFRADGDGTFQPRFMHFQDKDMSRGTLEIRLTPKKQWYLDAFLRDGKTNKGVTLIDSTQLHPADKWYWAAMTYDGKKMISYVNGVKQLESPLEYGGVNGAQTAFGMRLNKVNFFKGSIAEARFSPEALAPAALQKVKE